MQINLNYNYPKQQHFGMAIHSNDKVDEIIKTRIKDPAELKKLDNIFEHAKKNKLVDVSLMLNPHDKSICANIYSRSYNYNFFKQKNENFFSRNFRGGLVGFIEKCSNIADKVAEKIKINPKNIR